MQHENPAYNAVWNEFQIDMKKFRCRSFTSAVSIVIVVQQTTNLKLLITKIFDPFRHHIVKLIKLGSVIILRKLPSFITEEIHCIKASSQGLPPNGKSKNLLSFQQEISSKTDSKNDLLSRNRQLKIIRTN